MSKIGAIFEHLRALNCSNGCLWNPP